MTTAPNDSDIEQKRSSGVAMHVEAASISEEHHAYLVARHGTACLEPLPEMDDTDPLNWPDHKSAFEDIAVDFDVTIEHASYLTSLVICIIGVAPLVWKPLSDRFGRRPIFLLSLLVSAVGNIGCAKSPSYGTMGLCRAITALFICPAAAVGSGVVSECFFRHQRARYMGIWTLMVTLGVPTAPLIFGFVSLRVGYRWIYWTLACVNAIQIILYIFLGYETRYIRSHDGIPASSNTSLFKFRRIDPKPFTFWDFIHPLALIARPAVLIPAVAYAMVFLFSSVLIAIEIPQLFVKYFHFNTQQVGLQNISIITGSVLGEQIGGFLSDQWMTRQRRHKPDTEPEFRLWLSHVGYALAIAGIIVFLVCLKQAGSTWNLSPLVGAAIAAGGNQIVTTVLITYAVDSYPQDSAAIGVFVNFVRQVWGFIGPFWFGSMITSVGLDGSAGIITGLIVSGSVLTTIFLQWMGPRWRRKNATC
ncbi:MFS general substrate transporter [Thozetella sp. PMI_491]|nr:MFS general substrate transporter [Thozetella sp. PMI_491]